MPPAATVTVDGETEIELKLGVDIVKVVACEIVPVSVATEAVRVQLPAAIPVSRPLKGS